MSIRDNGLGWWVSSDMLNELTSNDGTHIVFVCRTSSSIEISSASSSSSNWSIRGIFGWMY